MSYGENYDKRVDLYSLGLTLYELSNCNRLPFASSAYVREGEIQLRIMGKELPVPENASRALANVILKACAFRAEDRFASAEEMYDALLAAEIGVSGEAEKGKDTKTSEGVRKNQDRPWLFPAICGVLILMILTLAPSWIYKSIQESKKQKSVTSSDAVPVPEEETVVEQSEAGDLAEAGKSQGIGNSQEPDGSFSPAKIEKLTTEEYAAIFGKAAYVAATLDNVAVIAENGDLYVWGNNKFGQVGCGNTKTQTRPVKILENVAHVEIGSSNVAALTNDGEFYIWGENYGAQIGDGSRNQKNSPVMIARNVKQMSLGNSSAGILLENGDLYTWGNPDENGFGVTQSSPALLASNIESFDLGWMFGGALTKDGELYMWGDNQSGEVGVGDTEPHLTPVKIMDNVAQIHLGFFTASAITEQGELYMWGDNALSQVGAGDGRDISEVREPICILTNVRDVFCSKEYNSGHGGAAVTLDGELYMWGDNDNCQLGEKEDSRIYEPKRISSIFYEKIQTVVLGRRHTAAITEDRKLYLCGSNGNNQINDSALWRVTGFEPVAENIVSVAVGWDVTYAVDGDGSFYCWGK